MTNNLTDTVRKAAITGVIAGGASMLLFGQQGSTDLFGVSMDVNLGVGLANAASSIAADLAHEYVLPNLPMNAKYANAESALVGLGVSGGATAFLLNRENIGDASSLNAFLLGAGSYAAGDYIDSTFFRGQSTAFSATW